MITLLDVTNVDNMMVRWKLLGGIFILRFTYESHINF